MFILLIYSKVKKPVQLTPSGKLWRQELKGSSLPPQSTPLSSLIYSPGGDGRERAKSNKCVYDIE